MFDHMRLGFSNMGEQMSLGFAGLHSRMDDLDSRFTAFEGDVRTHLFPPPTSPHFSPPYDPNDPMDQ